MNTKRINRLIKKLKDPGKNTRFEAAEKLIAIGKPVIYPLIKELVMEEYDHKTGYLAAEIFSEVCSNSVDPLLSIIEDPEEDLEIRGLSTMILNSVCKSDIIPFIQVLNFPDLNEVITCIVCENLIESFGKAAEEPLVNILSPEKTHLERVVLSTLIEIGGPTSTILKKVVKGNYFTDDYAYSPPKDDDTIGEFIRILANEDEDPVKKRLIWYIIRGVEDVVNEMLEAFKSDNQTVG